MMGYYTYTDFGGFGGFDVMSAMIPVIAVIGFAVILGIIVVSAVRGAAQWKKNNDSPVLTVEAGKANSHSKLGWQAFTDAVVASIAALPQPVAFLLWGAQAQKKAAQAAQSPYPRLVLTAPHPSPLSAYRGFFGSRVFSRTNQYLESHGLTPIDWQIENI